MKTKQNRNSNRKCTITEENTRIMLCAKFGIKNRANILNAKNTRIQKCGRGFITDITL
jgi:hypothetical protein